MARIVPAIQLRNFGFANSLMIKDSNIKAETTPGAPSWKAIVAKYQKPSIPRGLWQVCNTLVPYLAVWYLIYLSSRLSWWLALPLIVLGGGFAVRLFIIHHDCGHGSFFKSSA